MQSTFLPRFGFLAVLLAVLLSGLGAIVVAPNASAQTAPTAPSNSGAPAPAGRAYIGSLGDIVDDLTWNADLHGPLLIVSPEETKNYDNIFRPDGSIVEHARRAQPVPEADGRFSLEAAGAYFDRRVVKLPTVSVFAPTLMTVLNTTHLPKPDASAGLADQEKIQLMLSTFTTAEWRALGSAEGIGAADMTPTQRSLYLSILPDPFAVHTISQETHSDGRRYVISSEPTTLTPEQRESVRFSVFRQLDFMFDMGHGRGQGFGSGQDDHGPILQMYSDKPPVGTKNAAYGAILRDDVPARSKPGQLDFDWSALDASIPLGDAPTVGDLVARIAKATHADLYCDPRYRGRKLYVRGTTSARAGDLLHALAWAVTGAWRRLDNAFVLTDDLEGLGSRHATIAEWIQENRLLRIAAHDKMASPRAGKEADAAIGWLATDPLAPSDALIKKMQDYEDAGDPNVGRLPLHISTSELSPAAQASIKDEAKRALARIPPIPNFTPPEFRTDVIYVTPTTKPVFIVPGIGTVDAPGISLSGRLRSAGLALKNSAKVSAAPASEAPAFPTGSSVRALIVALTTDSESELAAREAKKRGFTELWVQAPARSSALIAGAIRAGKANGLAVRPVIRLLRADSSAKPDQLDRNVSGQTPTEYAKSWQDKLAPLEIPDLSNLFFPTRPESLFSTWGADWTRTKIVHDVIDAGDYLCADDPAVESALAINLQRVASVKGIAGVVLRETSPPGYTEEVYAPVVLRRFGASFSNDPLLGLGYTGTMRLSFLRKFGVDPVDLSTLSQGDFVNAGMTGVNGYISLQLPFFHDGGTDGVTYARNGMGGGSRGAEESLGDWCAFRASTNTGLVDRIVAKVKSGNGGVSLIIRHEADRLGDAGTYYGSVEPPAATDTGLETRPKVAAVTPKAAKVSPGKMDFGFEPPTPASAHETSKLAYYPITLFVDSSDSAAVKAHYRDRLVSELKKSAAWDGVVIDLSAVSVADAIEILGALPVSCSSRETGAR